MLQDEFVQKFKLRVLQGERDQESRMTYPLIPFSIEFVNDIKYSFGVHLKLKEDELKEAY